MLYNKSQYRKTNDKKVLHKIGKHWVTVSVAFLSLLGLGAVSTTTKADTTVQASKPAVTSAMPQQQNSKGSAQQVQDQAHQVHKALLMNATTSVNNQKPALNSGSESTNGRVNKIQNSAQSSANSQASNVASGKLAQSSTNSSKASVPSNANFGATYQEQSKVSNSQGSVANQSNSNQPSVKASSASGLQQSKASQGSAKVASTDNDTKQAPKNPIGNSNNQSNGNHKVTTLGSTRPAMTLGMNRQDLTEGDQPNDNNAIDSGSLSNTSSKASYNLNYMVYANKSNSNNSDGSDTSDASDTTYSLVITGGTAKNLYGFLSDVYSKSKESPITSIKFDTKVGNVNKLDTTKLTSLDNAFGVYSNNSDASDLQSISGLSDLDTSHVSDMKDLFAGDNQLTNISGLSSWNTHNVRDMSNAFLGDTSLNDIDGISNWDTYNLTNTEHMFSDDSDLTPNTNPKLITQLGKWNFRVPYQKSCTGMFENTQANRGLDPSFQKTSNGLYKFNFEYIHPKQVSGILNYTLSNPSATIKKPVQATTGSDLLDVINNNMQTSDYTMSSDNDSKYMHEIISSNNFVYNVALNRAPVKDIVYFRNNYNHKYISKKKIKGGYGSLTNISDILPNGWANASNAVKSVILDGKKKKRDHTINVVPRQASETVDYINNGKIVGTYTTSGNSEATNYGNDNVQITGSNQNLPYGYHLVSPSSEVGFANSSVDVNVAVNQGSEAIDYQYNGSTVAKSTATVNQVSASSVNVTKGIASGYHLASGVSSLVSGDQNAHDVNITPNTITENISYAVDPRYNVPKLSSAITLNDDRTTGLMSVDINPTTTKNEDNYVPNGFHLTNDQNYALSGSTNKASSASSVVIPVTPDSQNLTIQYINGHFSPSDNDGWADLNSSGKIIATSAYDGGYADKPFSASINVPSGYQINSNHAINNDTVERFPDSLPTRYLPGVRSDYIYVFVHPDQASSFIQYVDLTKGNKAIGSPVKVTGNQYGVPKASDEELNIDNNIQAPSLPNGYVLATNNNPTVRYDGHTYQIGIVPNNDNLNISYKDHGNVIGTFNYHGTNPANKITINNSNVQGMPAGYQLANPQSTFYYADGSDTVAVQPIQQTDTINYQYNGRTIATGTVKGSDTRATHNTFTIQYGNTPSLSNKYYVPNAMTFNYDGQKHNVPVALSTVIDTVNYMYGKKQVGSYQFMQAPDSSIVINDNNQPDLPLGYHLINSNNSFTAKNGSQNVAVAPDTNIKFTINFENKGKQVGSKTYTGTTDTAFTVNGSKDSPSGYVINPNQNMHYTFNGDSNVDSTTLQVSPVAPAQATETINFVYTNKSGKQFNEGSIKRVGKKGATNSVTNSDYSAMKQGWQANPKLDKNSTFTYNNGDFDYGVEPIQRTEKVWFVNDKTGKLISNDGLFTSTILVTGNDYRATDAGDNSFVISSAPEGLNTTHYKVDNPKQVIPYDGDNHVVNVHAISQVKPRPASGSTSASNSSASSATSSSASQSSATSSSAPMPYIPATPSSATSVSANSATPSSSQVIPSSSDNTEISYHSALPVTVTNKNYPISYSHNTSKPDMVTYKDHKYPVHYNANGKNTIRARQRVVKHGHHYYRIKNVIVSTNLPITQPSSDNVVRLVDYINFSHVNKHVWTRKGLNKALNIARPNKVISYHGTRMAVISEPSHWRYFMVTKNALAHMMITKVGRDTTRDILKAHHAHTIFIKRIVAVHGHSRNLIRYEFSVHHHNFWVTGRRDYVPNAYWQKNDFSKHHAHYARVIRACRLYKRARYGKKTFLRNIRRGTLVHVAKVIYINKPSYEQTRLVLTNGHFITANKNYVKIVK